MFFGTEQLLFVEAVDREYFIRKHKSNEKEQHSPRRRCAACAATRAIIERNQLTAMLTNCRRCGERAVSATRARSKWSATRALLICRAFRNIFRK